jgi:hypothetical protein
MGEITQIAFYLKSGEDSIFKEADLYEQNHLRTTLSRRGSRCGIKNGSNKLN